MEFNDVERIRQAVPEVEVITPNISRWGSTAIFGDKKSSCAVRGLQPDYEKIEAQNITMGRFINDVDILESRKVCTIGKRVYDELFPQGGNPCGQYLRVDGIYYQIVGVSLSTSMNMPQKTPKAVNRLRVLFLVMVMNISSHLSKSILIILICSKCFDWSDHDGLAGRKETCQCTGYHQCHGCLYGYTDIYCGIEENCFGENACVYSLVSCHCVHVFRGSNACHHSYIPEKGGNCYAFGYD